MILTKTIKLTSPTGTGNQATTGVGFQPKAILFVATYQTAEGTAANGQMTVGAATDSTHRGAIAASGLDNANPTDSDRRTVNTKCLTLIDNAGTVLIEADFVSMDADGFTLNFTTVQASNYILYALCLGGTDLTNVLLKEVAANTGTGSQAVTGVGFQPDALIVFSAGDPNIGTNTTGLNSFGFGLSSTSRASVNARFNNLDADTHTADISYKTDKIITSTTGGAVASWEADLTSLDSDGFTLNWTTAAGSARRFYFLCLKGGRYNLSVVSQPSGTGNSATTGVGFPPVGLLAFSSQLTAAGVSAVSNIAIGAGNSASSRFTVWNGVTDGVQPNRINMNNASSKFISMFDAGSSATLKAEADLVTLDSDGFTLNWTTADATARKIPILSLGSLAANSATSFTFTGPSSGKINSASTNFTVTPNANYTGTITITPTGTGSTGLSSTVLTFSGNATPQTFTITPTVAGSITLTATNNGLLTNPANLTYLVTASTFTFTGPSSGNVNEASTNFTVTPNASYTGTITITPTGTASTGLSPTVLTFSDATPQTFTITPTVTGSITLTPTNNGTLSNPANLTYTVTGVGAATAYTLGGPSSGTVNQASDYFTVTPNGTYTGTITVTPSGTASGGLSAIVLTFSSSSVAQSFQIRPTVTGLVTLTPTNSGSLTDPANLIYTVSTSRGHGGGGAGGAGRKTHVQIFLKSKKPYSYD